MPAYLDGPLYDQFVRGRRFYLCFGECLFCRLCVICLTWIVVIVVVVAGVVLAVTVIIVVSVVTIVHPSTVGSLVVGVIAHRKYNHTDKKENLATGVNTKSPAGQSRKVVGPKIRASR